MTEDRELRRQAIAELMALRHALRARPEIDTRALTEIVIGLMDWIHSYLTD